MVVLVIHFVVKLFKEKSIMKKIIVNIKWNERFYGDYGNHNGLVYLR